MKLDYNGNLQFSRYLGKDTGLGHDKYTGRDIALDRTGNIFIAGSMGVTRVSPDGSRFGTYPNSIIDIEGAYGIALDSADNIYLVGSQAYGALKLTPAGAVLYRNSSLGGRAHDIALDGMNNAYVTGTMGFLKLNPVGSAIKLTSLGGAGFDIAYRDGYVYIVGSTNSASFPSTAGAFDTTYDPSGDAFVAVLDSNGNMVYGSYLGGAGYDAGRSIAVDDEGRIFVTGVTYSSNFPTSANAIDRTLTGIGDAFVAVIDPAGNGASDLLYSTYLGGGDPNVPPYLMPDRGLGISVDEFGAVYLTGETGSADFPPQTQSSPASFTDVFLMKMDLPLDGYKTYLPNVLK
jgi:hypothetical protein